MNYMPRIRWATLLVAILAVLVVQPAGATALSQFTCGGWSVVPSPSPFTHSYLSGVAAVSPSDAWAVGVGYNGGSSTQTLIEHWSGSSWQLVSPATTGNLFGVTALSASDVWAVGQGGTLHGATKTLVMHWDGTQWRIIPSPNGKLSTNSLVSLAAVSASDIWAVGYTESNVDVLPHALIEHWNGTKWSIVPAANLGSAYGSLTSVTAVSRTDVWAVGYTIVNHYALLIEHWNGSQWSVVQAAPPGTNTYAAFTGVTASDASHVWAVGNLSNQKKILIESWNGHNWNLVSGPPNSQFASFYGIAAASADNIWSVGGNVSTSTIHFDGTKWSIVHSPNGPYSTDNVLNGVAMDSAQSLWAVGSSGDSSIDVYATLIEHYC